MDSSRRRPCARKLLLLTDGRQASVAETSLLASVDVINKHNARDRLRPITDC